MTERKRKREKKRSKVPVPALGDRIREVAAEFGSEYALAKALGDTERYKGRVSDWVAGGGIDASSLYLLCQRTGFSADWLLFGKLPKRRDEPAVPREAEAHIADRLRLAIARELVNEGVGVDEIDIDLARVLSDTASRLVAQLREGLARSDDARVVSQHAFALSGLLKHLGGFYQKPPISIAPRRTPIDERLEARYKAILQYAENRSHDIDGFAERLASSVPGISLSRYWERKYGENPGGERERLAIRNLESDEAAGAPFLSVNTPSDMKNFTRDAQEGARVVAKLRAAKQQPPTKAKKKQPSTKRRKA